MPNSAQSDDENKLELKIAYLNIIQNILGRMSNNVLIMKTTNVTALTAMLAFAATDKASNFQWWMFFIPWGLFSFFHAYFLYKESIFIGLYNDAISKNDFTIDNFKIDMEDLNKNSIKKIAKIYLDKMSFSYFQVGLILIILFSYQLGVK
ncbi:hypothetical protein KTH93_11580 [Acinetobacter bereziniae]|uniref:hypothetical protein n=1 Tax=Acinetobacter bereziniae TaxID=106648 RepID=UPI0021D2A7FA|nr:hypothetical protein [Acinetobacter bereziniae]MCU4436109.1 hypothetical protein [Acinetobacter bereziniae]